mgnify:CR=1 FL=1
MGLLATSWGNVGGRRQIVHVPTKIKRMWINQPSSLQPLRHLHGVNVLAYLEYDDTYCAYFLSGDTVCMTIPGLCLSEGWR